MALVREAAPRLRAERAEPASGAAGTGAPREELYVGLTRARAEGHLQLALDICQRLLESEPEDETARRAASEIEGVLQDREVEELVGLALSYAADGDMELAARVAEKVEQVAPWSPRYLQLQVYLDEEGARRTADDLAAAAREHLERGDLVAAREAAQRALTTLPGHANAQKVLAASPPPARDPRRAEIESLTTEALDHFVGNDHEKARAVIERVLALDPANRKARQLLRILGTLG